MTDERRHLAMDDGIRIALTMHFPDDVPPPWPVVFESRPYRKDDLSDSTEIYRRLCDEGGLAVCRADVRGTGSSEGVAEDEYTQREWDDWLYLIAWLAEQEWSNGSVGMYGTSYSGFNSLQVAALQPPALKAIIPIYATDRRYTDDVHFGGGVRRCLDFLDYPLNMVADNALPPVPSVFGEGWRDEWLRRIEANEPWELRWFEEQEEEPYWRHGSVWFDGYERIEAATLIIAGHADGYRNMAFRALERLSGPRQLLFGPWSHMSPRNSLPGPRIDHVPEMIRWWRRWLAGEDNGVESEPIVRIFVREPTQPRADLDAFEGRWRAETTWPPTSSSTRSLELGDAAAPHGDVLAVRGDVGVAGSIWCAADLPFGTPWDQRQDEAFSLVYEWAPEGAELEILGRPRVELTVTSSETVAFVSAKLCCVHPDGASELVTRGILNLTHRDGHEAPTPLTPDEPISVAFDLDATAFAFPSGSTIRLDVAGSDFASSWPPPAAGTITITPTGSRLLLPVVAPATLEPPVFAPGDPTPHRPARVLWEVRDDVAAEERRVVIDHGGLRGENRDGVRIGDTYGGEVGVRAHDPAIAWARGGTTYELTWPEVSVRTESRGTLRTDATTWYLELELDVYENGERIASRRWERKAPRHLR